jgi:signal transduction histidine kinase
MSSGMDLKKKFLRLRPADEQILLELGDVVEANAGKIVDAFYDHLLKFEATRSLLSDDEFSNRLKNLQKQYLITLVSGDYGDEYLAARKRIGQTHDRIKLLPQYYLGMYAFYFNLLYPLVVEKYKDNPERRKEAVVALVKIINLDSQIAMEAYIDAYHEKLEFLNKELERMNRGLEEKVNERTEQLKQFEQKLRQVERLAVVGTIASGIAHEVGTPLNIISGRVELLTQKVKGDERMQKDLGIITQQIDRITRIIRELLHVSRPREQAIIHIDLRELLSDILEFLRLQIEKAKIQTEIQLDAEIGFVSGDRDQLQQVFLNLIMNALQAMKKSGKLAIRTGLETKDGVLYACVQIEDTGKGIPKENLERIFDPFFSTKAQGEGTGLGLPIALDIIKKHGGQLSVESEVGVGTAFIAWLPVASVRTAKASES